MGAKKKKGLGSRLAKMSDEEKARYLQHRAQIEEEAKRRKEQLIATYMKNKLKKEEAFTRLNIAKINEYWHQILRKIKVQEQKTEIEDLRLWITKVIDIKNSIITRLMIEIEESEEQYQVNLKSHLSHVDNFIDMHTERQIVIQKDFLKHRNEVLGDAHSELKYLNDRSSKEEIFLKTILFGMEKNFNDFLTEMKQFRGSKLEDYSNSLRSSHETMIKTYGQQMLKIWREINKILREYLERTTQKRHHYIELKHLDERNQNERERNERTTEKCMESLNSLKMEHEVLHHKNENQIQDLTELRQKLAKDFQDLKRNLTTVIRNDEKILKNMSVISNSTIKNLEKTLQKGQSIRNFVTCCTRLQTPNEELIQWVKLNKGLDRFKEPYIEDDIKEDIPTKTYHERSKSASGSSDAISSPISPESELSEALDYPESLPEVVTDSLPEEYDFLSKLDGIWWSCNRAEIECRNLKKERGILMAENRNMKQIIKGILRDAALETPPPKDICFPVFSRVVSAPVRTQKMDLHGLDFLVIDV